MFPFYIRQIPAATMATMERPRPSSEEETPAVSSTPAKEESTKEAKPALPSDPEQAVEALEKRLEGLGGPTAPVSDADEAKKPAAAPAPTPAPPAAAKGAPAGKNALLVSSIELVRGSDRIYALVMFIVGLFSGR